MTGANYILVAEGVMTPDNKMFVTAKILNVETAKQEVTDNVLMGTSSSAIQQGCRNLASKMFGTMAGASTSTNKFVDFFTKGSKQSEMTVEDSIAAAQKAELAAIALAAKEQRRMDEQKFRQERAEAQRQAQEEKRLANEQARKDKEAAEAELREKQRLAKEKAVAEETERAKYYINRIDSKNYEYMGTHMDQKAYAAFLEGNCPAASIQYKKGKKLIGAGWGLFATGLVVGAGGGACLALAYTKFANQNTDYYYYDEYGYSYTSQTETSPNSLLFSLGISFISVGGALTIASIPILGVGYSKRNNAYKTYNNQCSSKDKKPLTLNLTAGTQSLGLALNF